MVNIKTRTFQAALIGILGMMSASVCAGCEIVDGGKKIPFDGSSLDHLLIEKRSLTILNKEYPGLNVIEKTFKGEIQTCSNCTDKHVVCSR